MSRESFSIEGLNEILDNLAKTSKEYKKAENRARQAGAKVVKEELEKNTPVGKRRTPKSKWGRNYGGHLAKTIVTSGQRTDKELMSKYVAVGWEKENKWRVHFPEFGTIYQKPVGFIQKTVRSSGKKVQGEMENEIRDVFK